MHILECIDCHLSFEGIDLEVILEYMQQHVRLLHNRELVYDKNHYEKKQWTYIDILVNKMLLNPELILGA